MRIQHILAGLIVALGLGVAANVAAAQPAQGKPKVVRDLLWVWATPERSTPGEHTLAIRRRQRAAHWRGHAQRGDGRRESTTTNKPMPESPGRGRPAWSGNGRRQRRNVVRSQTPLGS